MGGCGRRQGASGSGFRTEVGLGRSPHPPPPPTPPHTGLQPSSSVRSQPPPCLGDLLPVPPAPDLSTDCPPTAFPPAGLDPRLPELVQAGHTHTHTHTHSLQCVCVFLQEGHGRRGVAGHVLVGEVHELVDEGRQVAGRLSVALQSGSRVLTAAAPPPCPPHLPWRPQDGPPDASNATACRPPR